MKTSTAIIIMGGGAALLAAVATAKPAAALPTQAEIDASIKKTLDQIDAAKRRTAAQ